MRVINECAQQIYCYRDRAEGGAGGALAPPPHFFARIKIN